MSSDARERETAEDREVANELRVLLQLATPHLPPPEDRMERVLARVVRTRRRRRRAALAGGLALGLTAAVLAAAPALAPGPPGTTLGPAASGPAVSTSPGASPSPSSGGGEADGRTVRFALLDDVVIDVPEGWYDLTVQPGPGQPEPTGYLASQRLADAAGCPTRDDRQDAACLVTGTLVDDGVFMTLRLIRDPAALEKARSETDTRQNTQSSKECTFMGGARQMTWFRTLVLAGRAEVVQLSACLRRTSEETFLVLDRMLASLRPAGTAPSTSATSPTPSLPAARMTSPQGAPQTPARPQGTAGP
ncbi:hypothetical protein [Kitasatospora purpeofusca]|uniref:hypothetical protein n=1 Tax=Kitasatospora purpeofusca TaxID=67352 RepID=UPI0036D37D9A